MTRAKVSGAALAVAAVACFGLASPAQAQLFGGKRQDEAIAAIQARIAELQTAARTSEAQTKALTEAHNATRGELTAASARVDDLEATVKTLNGTSETLAADLVAARRDLQAAQAQNRDLLDRLARMEAAAAAPATAVPAASTAPADPVAAFAAARALMDAGRFPEAGDPVRPRELRGCGAGLHRGAEGLAEVRLGAGRVGEAVDRAPAAPAACRGLQDLGRVRPAVRLRRAGPAQGSGPVRPD
jgi:uncharacterized coiled-coil protein SlyX